MKNIERLWKSRGLLSSLLLSVSWLYGGLLALRHQAYSRGWVSQRDVSLPVVVVGNLSVGGTGKTPLCGYLVEHFAQAGWKPAIVSRGYGGKRHDQPHRVQATDCAADVGDEPLMLYRQTGVPVCVCTKRRAAVEHIAATTDANIVFSDDGLQHLAMARAAQILVVDGTRGYGNGRLLPAGPLRDSPSRLGKVDIVAIQTPVLAVDVDADEGICLHDSLYAKSVGKLMKTTRDQVFTLEPAAAISLCSGKEIALSTFSGQSVHAVAGIGHPQRFFDSLKTLGMRVQGHPMPDHHVFTSSDIEFADTLPVLVTSKDAVKLRELETLPESLYEISTQVRVSYALTEQIDRMEQSMRSEFFSISENSVGLN